MNTQWKLHAWLLPILILLFAACKKDVKPANESTPRSENEKQTCTTCLQGPAGTLIMLENKKTGKKTPVIEYNGEYYLQGDIVLSKEQIATLKGETDENARTGVSSFARMWPNRTVYYTIHPNLPQADRYDVEDAIFHWQQQTNLQFVLRTSQPDYVEFVPSNVCAATYGKIGGRQEIKLAPACDVTAVIHEIGHAIGFFHEQSRKDRWLSINIHPENIPDDKEYNFQTYVEIGVPGFQIGTLDFASVMLYDSYAFSMNGYPTITRLDGSTFGRNNWLSAGDIDTYNNMYNRPYFEMVKSNEQIINDGTEIGSTWQCDLWAYTDASKTQLVNLPWTVELLVSVTWEDQDAPGGNAPPQKWLLTPGSNHIALGEGYSIRNRRTGARRKLDFNIDNQGLWSY